MKASDSEWMSISDMMSGLMMIFMFIAISFMIQVQNDKDKVEESNKKLKVLMQEAEKAKKRIKNIAITYNKDKTELNEDLHQEFSKNLNKWEAEITQDNIIVFHSPTVLFDNGEALLKKDFQAILDDFFPRYIKILASDKYQNEIDEIRIEGHTSNSWSQKISSDDIYLNNMTLSQSRANNVLSYCYTIDNITINQNKKWLEKHFRANGMAFSKLKFMNDTNTPDDNKSRRVEFKVQMKTEEKIYKILEAS